MADSDVLAEVDFGHDWRALCDKQAKSSAKALAKLYMGHPIKNRVPYEEFKGKFLDIFNSQFEAEVERRMNMNEHERSDGDEEDISPKPVHKAFFRRLSFKSLRKGRGLFSKSSDDGKSRLAKIVVECRKEGLVNHLMGEQPDCGHQWERCRLALVKTIGGYMLEFFSPPKSAKPRSGVFCFLIEEARETTALEMPDHENTFVLKAENQIEYVIEAPDPDEMRSWLATIKYCMRAPRTIHEQEEARTMLNGNKDTDRATSREDRHGPAQPPPLLPPRVDAPVASSSRRHSAHGSISEVNAVDGQIETDLDLSSTLKDYPWFHGTLPRSEATTLVLHDGPAGHGIFLVRQSETRRGEFVLTFNFHGRAKHLRMTLNDMGQCRIQHFWFPSILEMLEHFQENAIPLESGGTAHVTLTQYVMVALPQHGPANGRTWPAHGTDRRPAPHPDVTEIVTSNGSVRTRTESLERLNGSSGSVGSARAVENTYSFV